MRAKLGGEDRVLRKALLTFPLKLGEMRKEKNWATLISSRNLINSHNRYERQRTPAQNPELPEAPK